MRSKRKYLRFLSDFRPVSYKTAYDAGEATLINISIGGCALIQPSQPLALHETVLITIVFPGENNTFQARGTVIRVDNKGCIAIKFILTEPEDQREMRMYFASLRSKT